MITEPTVFILGAGASKPYGFPTGQELRSKICENFVDQYNDFLNRYYESDRTAGRRQKKTKAEEFLKFYKRARGQPIDLFLARNPQFENIGKMAIILNIMRSELESKFDEDLDDKNRKQDWYNFLFEKMSDELISPKDFNSFKDNAIQFITFNYDRSLEHFLFDTLIHSFTELQNLLYYRDFERNNKLIPFSFIHVYGKIADLYWQHKSGTPYELEPPWELCENLIGNIRVIYDRANAEIEDAKSHINKAKNIFFLGFGYHNENLKVLRIPNIFRYDHSIFGTALGSTQKEIRDIRNRLIPSNLKGNDRVTFENNNLKIEDRNCRELLREHL